MWPLVLLGALLVAFLLAHFVLRAGQSKLIGDLMKAAVELDRTAAVDAFTSADLEPSNHFGTAMLAAWSVIFVILPLLPAFAAKRRLLAEVECLEAGGFAALGVQRVHDLEFGLLAQLLLVSPVAFLGISLELFADSGLAGAVERTIGALLLVLTVAAVVELARRYGRRRARSMHRRARIASIPLLLVCVVSIGTFFYLSTERLTTSEEIYQPPVSKRQIGEPASIWCPPTDDPGEGLCDLWVSVTAIHQNASCADPYRPLEPDRQFLRFDLDVGSPVDQFRYPELEANSVRLSHWGVERSDGVLETNNYVYTNCGDGTEDIAQPIDPGTRTKPVVVISAPKSAMVLELDVPEYGVYRWSIPPVGS
jgi:hypothetical protein